MVILLRGHVIVRKAHLHCMCLLMVPLGKVSRNETCAGWGFTAMKSYQNRDEVPMVKPVDRCNG